MDAAARYERRIDAGVERRLSMGLPPHFCRREIVMHHTPRHPSPGQRYRIHLRRGARTLEIATHDKGQVCLHYGDERRLIDVSELKEILHGATSSCRGRKELISLQIQMTTLLVPREELKSTWQKIIQS